MTARQNDEICKKIIRMVYQKYNSEFVKEMDMWYVGIVYIDALGLLDYAYAYFYNRSDAEHWFNEKVKNAKSYYSYVCEQNHWKDVELLKNYYKDIFYFEQKFKKILDK